VRFAPRCGGHVIASAGVTAPLTKDNAFRSSPMSIFNGRLGYAFDKGWKVQLDALSISSTPKPIRSCMPTDRCSSPIPFMRSALQQLRLLWQSARTASWMRFCIRPSPWPFGGWSPEPSVLSALGARHFFSTVHHQAAGYAAVCCKPVSNRSTSGSRPVLRHSQRQRCTEAQTKCYDLVPRPVQWPLSAPWCSACGGSWCPGSAPMPKLIGLSALPPARPAQMA
jgi:hypothetical protein